MEIKLVVFDMAGTTILDRDYVHTAIIHAMAAGGIEISRDEANRWMGYPKPYAIGEIFRENSGETAADATIQQLYGVFERYMVDFYTHDSEFCEITGAGATLQTLRDAGIKVALDTGFARPIMNAIIDRLGWGNLLDDSIASDEAPRGRPHPDMLQILAQRCNIADFAQIAKVGDTPSDLLQGTSAGCGLVVGVLSGSHTQAQLEPFPHSHLIGSVAELPELLGIGIQA